MIKDGCDVSKAQMRKLLQILPAQDINEIKLAVQAGQLEDAIERLYSDYTKVMTTAMDVINAIHQYRQAPNRLRIVDSDIEQQIQAQKKREQAFSRSLGAWPSESELLDEAVPLNTKLDLNQYRPKGDLHLQPL